MTLTSLHAAEGPAANALVQDDLVGEVDLVAGLQAVPANLLHAFSAVLCVLNDHVCNAIRVEPAIDSMTKVAAYCEASSAPRFLV